jgi:hypothetical protein
VLAQAGPEMPEREPSQPVRARDGVGAIEIALPHGACVSVDAFVNEKALSWVLRAISCRSPRRLPVRCCSWNKEATLLTPTYGNNPIISARMSF